MDFSFGDFNAEISAISPAALPPNKRRMYTLRKIIRNLLIVAYIVGFCTLFYFLFGKENVLIGATIATCSLKICKADMGMRVPQAMLSILISYALVAFGPLLGSVHFLLAIPVNFVFLYAIATLTGQNVLQKTEYYFLSAYIFAESAKVSADLVFWRVLAILLSAVYIAVLYFLTHQNSKRQHTFREVFQRIHLTSTRNRFAMRIAGGLMLTMLIGDIFQLQYAAWMGMPVLSLSMPFVQESRRRAVYRLIGTVFGSLVFLVLFHYVIPEAFHVWILLALLYLYLFLTDYRLQQMVISVFSINSATIFYGADVAIEMRIFLLLIGIAIVFAMNFLESIDLASRLERGLHRLRQGRGKV